MNSNAFLVEEMNTEIPDTIISGQWEEIFNIFDVCSSRHVLGLLFQSVGTGRGHVTNSGWSCIFKC